MSVEPAANQRGLLIRSDTLFTDAIEHLISGFPDLDLTVLDVEQGYESIHELKPDIIIVDECLPSKVLDQVLALARDLRECRVIMLNPGRNDFVLVNSRRATIRKAEDLREAIRGEIAGLELDASSLDQIQPAEQARIRSQMFAFLAHICNRRPDIEFVRRLRVLGVDAFSIASNREMSPEVYRGLQEMSAFIESTLDETEQHIEEQLAVDWTRLFRGVRPGYGPPPPYEGVYDEGSSRQVEILQSVMRFYNEYSVDLDVKVGNRLDYIGIELDFLRHINECQAEAWEKGEEQTALNYQRAEEHFLLNHLGRWAWKFCDLAMNEAKTDFYRGFIRLTKGVLNEEIEPSI